ncbi:MAG: flagellar hook-basal body complex protein, partial [Aestuariivirgaceae bacterium]
MPVSMDVALSAQIALVKRLDTIAHNVANVSTAGFRADGVSFESLVSQQTKDPTAFASSGQTHVSRAAGPITNTNNPLDVAIQGDAWFAFEGPSGTVYT